ncbi:hypothetical protein BHE74_00045594 [Ensete ventricosum]|nr:hypothetical protein BHE74_00045594 [Ensete ventricosum]
MSSSPVHHRRPCPRTVATHGSPARRCRASSLARSRAMRRNVPPRGEKDRGDRYALCVQPGTGTALIPIICGYTDTDR